VWVSGPSGALTNQSVFVDSELWIEGQVFGKMTFAASDTIFIVNSITYANTNYPDVPDDMDNPNMTDYFGLVSEEKLLIRYKHRDPFSDDYPKVGPNLFDIILYGSYAALGDGDEELFGEQAVHYDGIFTFQYQHGHGSTPDYHAMSPYTGQDTIYSYVDLHKFIFPINSFVPPTVNGFNLHGAMPMVNNTCGYPVESASGPDPNGYNASFPNNGPSYTFPSGTDYPWYNPVWPESSSDIVFERGTIHIYGSIAQRRRGFVHRSGSDPFNHPYGNSNPSPWDMENFKYSGNHGSCGYAKDYHYDQRLLFEQPPDYPEVYKGFGGQALSAFDDTNWIFKAPTY
jgi:hypothetical protein